MDEIIVDSHCHLNFPEFHDCMKETIDLARKNKVGYIQTICTKLSEFDKIHQIANDYPNIFCSVGVHPCEVENHPKFEVHDLVSKAASPKVIGLGETGLDYFHKDHAHIKKGQKIALEKHIEAARSTKLPLIIHTREADKDTIEVLTSEYKNGEFTGLIHCFTAGTELAKRMIDIGFYISISGIITFKNAKELQAIVKELPLNKLLIETDSPYLAPVPHRGKPNQPGYVKYVAEYLADMYNTSYQEVANITTSNFFKLFTKAEAYVRAN